MKTCTSECDFEEKVLTNATRSVPAPAVGFLLQDVPSITADAVREVLIKCFKEQFMVSSKLVSDLQSVYNS